MSKVEELLEAIVGELQKLNASFETGGGTSASEQLAAGGGGAAAGDAGGFGSLGGVAKIAGAVALGKGVQGFVEAGATAAVQSGGDGGAVGGSLLRQGARALGGVPGLGAAINQVTEPLDRAQAATEGRLRRLGELGVKFTDDQVQGIFDLELRAQKRGQAVSEQVATAANKASLTEAGNELGKGAPQATIELANLAVKARDLANVFDVIKVLAKAKGF